MRNRGDRARAGGRGPRFEIDDPRWEAIFAPQYERFLKEKVFSFEHRWAYTCGWR